MSMTSHLNEFNTVFDQLNGQSIQFNDSLKALFLLITLSDSWDTFQTTISNTAITNGMSSTMVESSLLIEEVNRKNVDTTQTRSALMVRGRSTKRGKGKERNKI